VTHHIALVAIALLAPCALFGVFMACDRLRPPAVLIRDHEDAKRAVGRLVELRGRALDAKPAGRVENDVFALYCLNISLWPREVVDKDITVQGILEHSAELSSSDPMDQSLRGGPVYLIRRCKIVR
jgi:hypothetical protein